METHLRLIKRIAASVTAESRNTRGTVPLVQLDDPPPSDTELVMLNPWMFGLESVHQAWRAQNAMAFRLVRLFGGGDPDQTTSTPLIQDAAADTKAQEDAPNTAADVQKASAAIIDVRRHKARKASRISKTASPVKPPSVTKRAAAASQNRASKVVRRSKRTPR
jgi:hypothetical protein